MFIHSIPEESAEGPLADFYREQAAAWGFLPNFALAFSTRPDVATAWTVLNKTVRSSMDRRRYELATIAAARALHSTYCTAAHSKFLRDVCDDEPTMIAIAEDPSGAGLGELDRTVYQFASRVAGDAASIEQSDVDALRQLGLTDADVADIVFAAAARALRASWTGWAHASTSRPPRPSLPRSSTPWSWDDPPPTHDRVPTWPPCLQRTGGNRPAPA